MSQLAEEHGISSQTIYGWLGKGVTAPPSVLEVSRLKRENQTLMEIIGRLTVQLSLMEKRTLIGELGKEMHLENPTKQELAQKLGISRSSLYYHPTLPEKDWQLKIQIEQVLHDNPSYGSQTNCD